MKSFRENKNYLFEKWFEVRKEDLSSNLSDEDRLHRLDFDEICEEILECVSEKEYDFVRDRLDLIEDNWINYLGYWNEKFYRHGFCDGLQLIGKCFGE